MRNSRWTPSIVPNGDAYTVYLVKDDVGALARFGARRTRKQPTSKPSSPT